MISEAPESKDLLERMGLAKKIVKTLQERFEEGGKGVRIGIHGEWGSGKSTLLNLVEEQLEETYPEEELFDTSSFDCLYDSRAFSNKNKPYEIIKFDLSEYGSLEDLSDHFNNKLLKKIPVINNLPNIILFIFIILLPLAQWEKLLNYDFLNSYINKNYLCLYMNLFYYFSLVFILYKIRFIFCKFKFSRIIYTFFTSLLRSKTGKNLESLEKFLGLSEKVLRKITDKKHLLIIIDEIDRAKPQVVHDVLLRLKQVMDVGKKLHISFILSFDPSIVIGAIEECNKAYKNNGEFFLEKIIECPYHLISTELAEKELLFKNLIGEKFFGSKDISIKRIANFVPENPRQIKMLVSYLINIDFERFDKENTDFESLVFLCSLKILAGTKRFNKFLEKISDNYGARVYGFSKNYKSSNGKIKNRDIIGELLEILKFQNNSEKITNEDKIIELLSIFLEESSHEYPFYQASKSAEYFEIPPIITFKECNNLIDSIKDEHINDDESLSKYFNDWLKKHKESTKFTEFKIVNCLIKKLPKIYELNKNVLNKI